MSKLAPPQISTPTDGRRPQHRSRALVAAVPELGTYRQQAGIARSFHCVVTQWADRVRLVNAAFEAVPLPVLRNFPFGVDAPPDADIVFLPKMAGAQALRRTYGLPSVVLVHDIGIVDFPGDRTGMSPFTYHSILQSFRGLEHASHLLTVSRFTHDRLLHYLPQLQGRVSIVPNGIRSTFHMYTRSRNEAFVQIQAAVGAPLRAPLIIYVGSEIPRKNVVFLLRVLKQLQQQHPSAQLLKIGAPGEARWRSVTLQAAAQLGLQVGKDILFFENSDDDLLADAYQAADVYVSASLYEGFNLPVVEAMAVGTPVVVANRGASPDVVRDVGWVVEPTVEQFVRAIDEALCLSRGTEQVRKGQARAASCTWAKAAEQYLEIIQHACQR